MSLNILFLLAFAVHLLAQPELKPHPWRSEPNILSQTIDVKQLNASWSELSPGYLFFAPELFTHGWGPKIYSLDGHLIWDGEGGDGLITQQFHVCDYAGQRQQHLCWHEASVLGAQRKNGSDVRDYHRIFDNSYTQIGPDYYNVGNLGGYPDSHEFRLVENGTTFLQTNYVRKQMDLTPWGGPKDAWIQDSCFQEVDLRTGEPVFTWCYTDHLPIQTHLYLHIDQQLNFTTVFAGDGSWLFAWDFFHINSVDKNEEGDFLISGRHADEIIKLAGPNSCNGAVNQVLWRLGGDSNDFEMRVGFTFTRQHHARFLRTSRNSTLISIFDNAWEGEAPKALSSQPYSSGKFVLVDNATKTAKLVGEYPHPYGEHSRSGGSVQLLANGNVFIGWGFIREVSEFHIDGTLLYHAHLVNGDGMTVQNYRNFKFPWVGKPAWPPKLLAYSQSCASGTSSKLLAYASWNGATEVTRWRFWKSTSLGGPWIHAGTFRKVEFETVGFLGPTFYPHVAVEALDKDDNVVAKANTTTFVPTKDASKGCDEDGCFLEPFRSHEQQYSCAKLCKTPQSYTLIIVIFLLLTLELWMWLLQRLTSVRVLERKQQTSYLPLHPVPFP